MTVIDFSQYFMPISDMGNFVMGCRIDIRVDYIVDVDVGVGIGVVCIG